MRSCSTWWLSTLSQQGWWKTWPSLPYLLNLFVVHLKLLYGLFRSEFEVIIIVHSWLLSYANVPWVFGLFLPSSLKIAKKFPEFVSGVLFRCALHGRHCLPQIIITSITHTKISVLFSIFCCLWLSNEKGTVKSGLLNWASKFSSFDIFSLWVLVLLCFSAFFPVLCHKDIDVVVNKTHNKKIRRPYFYCKLKKCTT